MIGILAIVGLLVAYGAAGAGRVGLRAWREWSGERAAQRAYERRQPLVVSYWRAVPSSGAQRYVIETPQERAARLAWRAHWEDRIAEVNAQFDALVAGMPLHDDAPFDPSYWPAVEAPEHGPEVEHVDLTTLAEFEPRAALALVEQDNAAPTVFSWHTCELPLVERPVCVPVTLRPRRRRDTLRRALGAPPQSLTF